MHKPTSRAQAQIRAHTNCQGTSQLPDHKPPSRAQAEFQCTTKLSERFKRTRQCPANKPAFRARHLPEQKPTSRAQANFQSTGQIPGTSSGQPRFQASSHFEEPRPICRAQANFQITSKLPEHKPDSRPQARFQDHPVLNPDSRPQTILQSPSHIPEHKSCLAEICTRKCSQQQMATDTFSVQPWLGLEIAGMAGQTNHGLSWLGFGYRTRFLSSLGLVNMYSVLIHWLRQYELVLFSLVLCAAANFQSTSKLAVQFAEHKATSRAPANFQSTCQLPEHLPTSRAQANFQNNETYGGLVDLNGGAVLEARLASKSRPGAPLRLFDAIQQKH